MDYQETESNKLEWNHERKEKYYFCSVAGVTFKREDPYTPIKWNEV